MAADPDKPWRFQPGGPGGPGRPKGSRSKLGEAFLQALCDDFKSHGESVIAKVREEKPDVYMKVCASILPKEIEIKRPLEDMTEDELVNAIELIRASLGGGATSLRAGSEAAQHRKPH